MEKLTFQFLIIFSLLSTFNLKAQDPAFSQPFSTAIYNNPAFTGCAGKTRIQAAQRIQWPNSAGGFYTSYLAVDVSRERFPVDLGLTQTFDLAAGILNTYSVGLSAARSFRIKHELSLRLGVSAGLTNRRLNTESLKFGDQIDSHYGFIYQSSTILPPFLKANFLTVNAGVILNSKFFIAGYAAVNLNRPDQNLLADNQSSALPIRHTIQAAIRIPLPLKSENCELLISGLYLRQSAFKTSLAGIILRYKRLKAGTFYRHNDAYIGMLGYFGKSFRLSYSYDMTVSRLTNNTGAAHELALSLLLGKPNEKRPAITWLGSLF